ncbi:MAG TPA: phosphoenolpyruvate--protein phosphotransferase [Longimicrobiales bacterium]|nr:phosphoenolpyruvate--protein phosphotransferase [Longimicrobiales bacterium]
MHVGDGIPASPGIVIGPARVVGWDPPRIAHETIEPSDIDREIERFNDARATARDELRVLMEYTARRLGSVEAQIFEPQLLMLDDVDLVERTIAYIRENHLSAARAFSLRLLEFRSEWRGSGHPMVMDRLNDLMDVEIRILRALLGLPHTELIVPGQTVKSIVVARELTPSLTVQLDRDAVLGVAIDAGSRTSHSAIIARALEIPAVVGLTDLAEKVETGDEIILDGREGRVIVNPTTEQKRLYRERDIRVREWDQELILLAHLEAATPDRQPLTLRANIDLPAEATSAREHGAQGVGLFRTEFLVVGRSIVPEEEEQYEAYRQVTDVFPDQAVFIRTFDLGGDKFPRFLHLPPEENPFLGWRAIRVCLDMPDLFRTQLRAALRATAHGDVRIMVPFITDIAEIQATREMLEEQEAALHAEGIAFNAGYKLGIMIETPAAALIATELTRYADFFSIGTNDLVQYTLAVDRGNAKLAPRFKTFHPAVLRLIQHTAHAARAAGIELSCCGEMAAHPLGVLLLMGLDVTALSMGATSLPEIKKLVRSVPMSAATSAVEEALGADTAEKVSAILTRGIEPYIDLSLFTGRWNLAGSR